MMKYLTSCDKIYCSKHYLDAGPSNALCRVLPLHSGDCDCAAPAGKENLAPPYYSLNLLCTMMFSRAVLYPSLEMMTLCFVFDFDFPIEN